MVITQRQEEVLSYIVGLAPIGQPFQVKHRWLATDFVRMNHSNFNQLIKVLVRIGAVKVVQTGIGATPSTLTVLKRPEDFEVLETWGRVA